MVIRTPELDAKFLAYLVDGIEGIFMSSYLPDEAEENSVSGAASQSDRAGDVDITSQYGLDKDVSDPIVLSIGNIVVKVCAVLNPLPPSDASETKKKIF